MIMENRNIFVPTLISFIIIGLIIPFFSIFSKDESNAREKIIFLESKISSLECRILSINEKIVSSLKNKNDEKIKNIQYVLPKNKKKHISQAVKFKSLSNIENLSLEQIEKLNKIFSDSEKQETKKNLNYVSYILSTREKIEKILTDEQRIEYLKHLKKNNTGF